MSLAAALAMDDLADCLEQEAQMLPRLKGRECLVAMARAHRRAAERIRARAEANMGGPVPVPAEFQERAPGS